MLFGKYISYYVCVMDESEVNWKLVERGRFQTSFCGEVFVLFCITSKTQKLLAELTNMFRNCSCGYMKIQHLLEVIS